MVIPSDLFESVEKIQDTLLICAPVISQHAAVGALQVGREYCRSKLASIASVRERVLEELGGIRHLCAVPAAEGAFYVLLRVDTALGAMELVERLVSGYGVAVIPGTTFGLTRALPAGVVRALTEGTVAEGAASVQGLVAFCGGEPVTREARGDGLRPSAPPTFRPGAGVLALVWGITGGRRCRARLRSVHLRRSPHSWAAIALFGVALLRGDSLRPKAFCGRLLRSASDQFVRTRGVGGVLGSAGEPPCLRNPSFWLLALAWPLLGERIRGLQWAAVALALVGLEFILAPWDLRGWEASALAVGGGLSWAIASVFFKIVNKRHELELVSFTAWQTLLGSLPLIVIAVLVDPAGPDWTGSLIVALVYNVIIASAVAYVIWMYVLQNLPAGTAGISSLAIPVVGVVAAWVQLGERPGVPEAVGMGLILAALAILTARGLLLNRRVS